MMQQTKRFPSSVRTAFVWGCALKNMQEFQKLTSGICEAVTSVIFIFSNYIYVCTKVKKWK